jgi:hypothetical protein
MLWIYRWNIRLNEISENGVEIGYYCDLVTTVVVVTAMNDIVMKILQQVVVPQCQMFLLTIG